MRKFYSLVLMATALLFGTNVWAVNVARLDSTGFSQTYTNLITAFSDVKPGTTAKITLLTNTSITSAISIGNSANDEAGRNITLDFAGNKVSSTKNAMFKLYRGSLNLMTSVKGDEVGLYNTYTGGKYRTIWVYGSILKNCDPSQPNSTSNPYYTHLTIEEGVKIVSDGILTETSKKKITKGDEAGICVMVHRIGNGVFNGINSTGAQIYGTDQIKGDPRGVANGVRIDIKGTLQGSLYAIQTNGEVACPDSYYQTYYDANKETYYGAGTTVTMQETDINYSPYIYIHDKALLENTEVSNSLIKNGQVALYTSGYARWYVEGECSGTTGLYMKSGAVTLADATITSTADEATEITSKTIGVNGGGNAIVVESNNHYSGNIVLNIEGDTKVETQATDGTALFETIENASTSDVDHITINGGTFTGDNAIAISDQTVTNGKVTVYGGNLDGAIALDINDILPKSGDYHTTDVVVDGKTTVVVSAGTGPAASNTVIGATELTAVKWNGTTPETLTGSKTLTELEINETFAQTLNIADGAKLIVGRLILGDNAKVVVKAGGKLIITGAQGVNASKVSNIVLESSQEKQAVLLFSPDVNTNRYPKATVNMYVAKGKDGSDNVWTRFGMPIKSLDAMKRANAYTTWIYEWDYVANAGQGDWALVANVSTDMEAWKGYTLSYDNEGEQTYTFEGSLVGNGDAPVNFVHRGYNYFGNSYTSYVDAKTLVESLPDAIDETVYMWDVENQNYASATKNNLVNNPERLDAAWQKDIAPMTTFILRLMDQDNASTNIDYASAIWSNPRHGNAGSGAAAPAMHAPARIASDETFIKMVVTAANGMSDRINLTEGSEYTDAYERGYDAAKYMNEKSINLYASIDGENYGDVASNTLVGKTISLQTVNDVNYIISFKHADANEYALLDKVTGQKVDIEEGATYEFTAQPNSKIEERFEIVERQNILTAIENTEVKANAKGIYSITGLYLGEDFNALPAGVYVVNGVKVVK